MTNLKVLMIAGLILSIFFVYQHKDKPQSVENVAPKKIEQPKVEKEPAIVLSNPNPAYQNYGQVVTQLTVWNKEAPFLTELGTYGTSAKGTELRYIRINNKNITTKKPVVLIHGCIHGNEPLSTAVVMNYIGSLLSNYKKSEEVTNLINTRDIYFVPLLSPDSHPNSRFVDGVDPNRDFPGPTRPNHQSSPSVKAIQDLFEKINPAAVISGHTYGRVFLYPLGHSYKKSPNDQDYLKLMGEMSKLSGYRVDRICNNYPTPIVGTESDWYYQHGAISVVVEYGEHQKIPTKKEIDFEFNKTWKAFLHFCKEAPLIKVKN